MLLRVLHKVPDDQKVTGVSHAFDNFDLVREPLLVVRKRVRHFAATELKIPNTLFPSLITDAHYLLEVIVRRQSGFRLRYRVIRQVVNALWQFQFAAFGDLNCPLQCARQLGAKDVPHLFGRTHIKIGRSIAQTILIVNCFARTNTQQQIMRSRVIRL